MNAPNYQIVSNGDAALTILFADRVSYQLSSKIIQLSNQVKQEIGCQLQDIVPAYQSLTLYFDPLTHSTSDIKRTLEKILNTNISVEKHQSKLIEIPVCYENEFSPDLSKLADYCQLTPQQVIQQHSKTQYLVHMLGFLPGFIYLGGLSERLICPRKSVPALQIPAGSVAIGGDQTGIYPIASPGGWHIIGRTPISLFKPQDKQPFIASPLDQIKFKPISQAEYYQQQIQAS